MVSYCQHYVSHDLVVVFDRAEEHGIGSCTEDLRGYPHILSQYTGSFDLR